jgi:hypothetical protein
MDVFALNLSLLQSRFPHLASVSSTGVCRIAKSISGENTLTVQRDGIEHFIHSPIYPKGEARSWISQFQTIERDAHVIFFGAGLGYHVEAFHRQHPQVSFSIFEPCEAIAYAYLHTVSIDRQFSHDRLTEFIIGRGSFEPIASLAHLIDRVSKVLVIAWLPYTEIFREQFQSFNQALHQLVSYKRDKIAIHSHFEKDWASNSMYNFLEVVRTPNFLDVGKTAIKGKPVVLVAAGPSLQDEIENIRYIRERDLAYIFSVGSAINTLLEYDIYPHATFTYDPSPHNVNVIRKMKDRGIDSIPLVFGSTVGRGTLDDYAGPKLHLIISQDSIAQQLLRRTNGEPPGIVNDAPTVAVIALQAIIYSEASIVILVGQNFAYKGNDYYASGVPYAEGAPRREGMPEVDSTCGGKVVSNSSLIRMKREMEFYLHRHPHIEVLNTTKDGANIVGAAFCELRDVILQRLHKKTTEAAWYLSTANCEYDINFLRGQVECLSLGSEVYQELLAQTAYKLMDIAQKVREGASGVLFQLFVEFDQLFDKLLNNHYYKVYFQPRNRVSFELLYGQMNSIKNDNNALSKAEKILRYFGEFIHLCQQDYEHMKEAILRFHQLMADKELSNG